MGKLFDTLCDSAHEGLYAYAVETARTRVSKSALSGKPTKLPKEIRKLPDSPERDIQKAIIAYAKTKGMFLQRLEASGKIMHTKNGAIMGQSCMTGMPDILIIYRGIAVGLEVKRPSGSLSPEQISKMSAIRCAGGIAIIGVSICAIDAIIDFIDQGKPLPMYDDFPFAVA